MTAEKATQDLYAGSAADERLHSPPIRYRQRIFGGTGPPGVAVEVGGATCSFITLSLFFVFIGWMPAPNDPLEVVFGWVMLAWFGISLSLLLGGASAFSDIVAQDPAIDTVTSFTGGGNGTSTARMFAQLKPIAERKTNADQVIARLRKKTAGIPGASLFFQSVQDVSVGGRFGGAQYQYTLQADNLEDLYHWAPVIMARMRQVPELRDINSDQQDKGLQSFLAIDRDTAGRLGVSMQDIDNTLGDAFGQRQVSTIYKGLNQYHVVLEVAPEFQQTPDGLKFIYVPSNTGKLVPLSSFAHYEHSNTALSVNHQGIFPAITLSFNLAQGASLGPAVEHIQQAMLQLGVPNTVHATFQGTAQAFQDSLKDQLIWILAALAAVYIVLGILYESFIHPLTILSTLPPAPSIWPVL